jgi:1-deoxy-D-xylulose-5-phosphate synthase
VILDDINSPSDLKRLDTAALFELSSEIRQTIIQTVLTNGGHLASNLGVVELTLALHYVFDTPSDKLIFDVGHQCYAHKLLTGRRDKFSEIRKKGGISGFIKASESEFDVMNSGHAGTALSIAAGLMRARNLEGADYEIVAVVGDGALGNGLSAEALNDISGLSGKLIIIINDNGMTINKSVGGLAQSDKSGIAAAHGIKFLGSVDGHDLEALTTALNAAKASETSVLLRVQTIKGKGFSEAEDAPDCFHSVSNGGLFSENLGGILADLADLDPKIVAVTAAMRDGTGLAEFARRHPDRFFDAGLAEGHAVIMAAALAKCGFKPFVAIYSTFLQRAYDQIIHDVLLDNLPVVFLLDHAGTVSGDGESHQGIYDLSYLLPLPAISVFAPASKSELPTAVRDALALSAPAAVRYPKSEPKNPSKFLVSDINALPREADVILLSSGARPLEIARRAADILMRRGLNPAVANMFKIKPFPAELIGRLEGKIVATVEDNVAPLGFGSYVLSVLNEAGADVKVMSFGVKDAVLPPASDEELIELAGLSPSHIAFSILKILI